ncbi:MAG: histidine kinase [Arthrobacter sp.]|nr:histidine kinase [Arthrobacter sp.]
MWRALGDRHHSKLRRYVRAHPVLMDVAACASYVLLSMLTLVFAIAPASPSWGWVLGVMVLIGASLFFRRRFPLAVLVIVTLLELGSMLLGLPLTSMGMGLWFALYAVARQYAAARVYTVAFIVTVLESVSLLIWYRRTGAWAELESGTDAASVVIILAMLVGLYAVVNALVVFFGSWVRNQRLHEAELELWARRAQDLARGRERNRIAGEMHDIVAHSLSVMIALSDGARKVGVKNPERALSVMGDVSRTGRAALADLRRSLGVLRAETQEVPLGPAGAGADLDGMLDGFRATGLPLRVDREGLLPQDPALRLSAVRIVQESLTNALRYAKDPTEVLVWMRADEHGVHLRVRDDGRHASRRPRSQGSGIGLSGMVERARLFGGSVTAGPLESGGWGVEAWLPAPQGQESRAARGREDGREEES